MIQHGLRNRESVQPDAMPVLDARPDCIEQRELRKIACHIGAPPARSMQAVWKQLGQLGLVRAGHLTLAGMLLVAKSPQFMRPEFCLKARYVVGNDIAALEFIDSEEFEGRLSEIFTGAFAFLCRNLRKVQRRRSPNWPGSLEIPASVLEELLCNALLHRDYLISAPIRLLLFENRVEIISPGLLPGGLTVAKVLSGATYIRNPLLTSFAMKGLLPYAGLGSGMRRVIKQFPGTRFVNDIQTQSFKAILQRNRRASHRNRCQRRSHRQISCRSPHPSHNRTALC